MSLFIRLCGIATKNPLHVAAKNLCKRFGCGWSGRCPHYNVTVIDFNAIPLHTMNFYHFSCTICWRWKYCYRMIERIWIGPPSTAQTNIEKKKTHFRSISCKYNMILDTWLNTFQLLYMYPSKQKFSIHHEFRLQSAK